MTFTKILECMKAVHHLEAHYKLGFKDLNMFLTQGHSSITKGMHILDLQKLPMFFNMKTYPELFKKEAKKLPQGARVYAMDSLQPCSSFPTSSYLELTDYLRDTKIDEKKLVEDFFTLKKSTVFGRKI